MGTVAIRFRLMPEGPETDLKAVEAAARDCTTSLGAKVLRVEVRPFAFGLNAMEMAVTMPDKQGSPEAIELALAAIEGVQSAEIVELGLL
jgi:elongation factor 1-beta